MNELMLLASVVLRGLVAKSPIVCVVVMPSWAIHIVKVRPVWQIDEAVHASGDGRCRGILTFMGLIALLDSAILNIGEWLMILMDDRDEEESWQAQFEVCSLARSLALSLV